MQRVEMMLRATGAVADVLVARSLLHSHDDPMPLALVQLLLVLANVHTALVRCGVDIPFVALVPSFVPYAATVRFHDDHHRTNRGNFGGAKQLWDAWFGTLE
jgi:sterol desaturase/sphingolipid hydroxylase (fatty acid hydroxylase superfamily)